MVFPKSLLKYSSLVLTFAFGACAGNMTVEERRRVGAVRVHRPATAPKASLYSDATSATASAVGAQFGLIGGLVGGSIAAVSIEKGRKRFAPVTQPQVGYVAEVVRTKFEDGIKRSGKLPVAANTLPSGSVKLDRVLFGVGHVGEQRFNVIISSEVKVHEPNGKEVWRKLVSGTSITNFSLDEAMANPRVFQTAVDDAAGNLAEAATNQM